MKKTKTKAEEIPAPKPIDIVIDLDDPQHYINRELGQLAFQRRVFEEAQDPSNPLLERVKFIAIVGSNLDEFFMVRVGGLCTQASGIEFNIQSDDLSPREQLAAIRKTTLELMQEVENYLMTEIRHQLDQAGIHILSYKSLDEDQVKSVNEYFNEVIFPVLTPLAFDPGHPFPHISNQSLNLAVLLSGTGEEPRFARLKIPDRLPYLVPVKNGGPQETTFVWITQVIRANLHMLFPGMMILDAHPFHVTRNSEMDIDEFDVDDLLETMEESVRKRRFGNVVRLLVNPGMCAAIREILVKNLNIDDDDIYELRGPLVLRNLMQLYRLNRPDLKFRPLAPAIPPQLQPPPAEPGRVEMRDDSFFAAIRRGDILLHHPYDSFTPVIDFLQAAARDPNVLAIKQTLYRVGNNSPVVRTLLQASREYGKQVAVLVELKARFDEESNIGWARLLEQEGVHVTYGLLGLKTHSKIALVVRKEGEHIRRYVHLGTGNYNHITAQLYEDLCLFTCDDQIGADATDLFNYLTGYSLKQDYRKLLVAPLNLRPRLEDLIRQEIENQRRGKHGYIAIKTNALIDKPVIKLLYQASQAGVKVDLIVRAACALKPGVPGLSENIRVISVLGRFLEHSRIYFFHNDGDEKMWLGSADVMPRNLNQRVEVLFPIQDARLVQHIRDEILHVYLTDNIKARLMEPDGNYHLLQPEGDEPAVHAQEWFMEAARQTT